MKGDEPITGRINQISLAQHVQRLSSPSMTMCACVSVVWKWAANKLPTPPEIAARRT
jgi:hypothetical protein